MIVASFNGHDFNAGPYSSVLEAILDAQRIATIAGYEGVWVGRTVSSDVSLLFVPSFHTCILGARQEALDKIGGYAEGWLDKVSQFEADELEFLMRGAVLRWFEKHPHLKPGWFEVDGIEYYSFEEGIDEGYNVESGL